MFIYIRKFSQGFKLRVMMERQTKAEKLNIWDFLSYGLGSI